jgi:hypothetical protein
MSSFDITNKYIKYILLLVDNLCDFKISYIYINSHVDSNSNKKIIKIKMTILLHSINDYMILTVKIYLKIYTIKI